MTEAEFFWLVVAAAVLVACGFLMTWLDRRDAAQLRELNRRVLERTWARNHPGERNPYDAGHVALHGWPDLSSRDDPPR